MVPQLKQELFVQRLEGEHRARVLDCSHITDQQTCDDSCSSTKASSKHAAACSPLVPRGAGGIVVYWPMRPRSAAAHLWQR